MASVQAQGPLPTVAPVVTTTAATGVTPTGATLNGKINAKGFTRAAGFEYGTTKTYGTTVLASQSPLAATNTVTPVSATVTGLAPHTLYHFRAIAAADIQETVTTTGSKESANGADMTFTSGDSTPTTHTDRTFALPGTSIVIDVLANDSDPDKDRLTILSFTNPIPASAGKVTRVSGKTIGSSHTSAAAPEQLMFTASSSFSVATFTYTVSDGFGGTASGAVLVNLAPCAIDLEIASLISIGGPYSVRIATDADWVIENTLPWVTATPMSGSGDTKIEVTLKPNTALTSRAGAILIGGKVHAITQQGVLPPQIYQPKSIPKATVSGDYNLSIPTDNAPVTYKVTNLPPGLSINQDTGVISGKPTLAGTYPVTIQASNLAGSTDLISFDIDVSPLPDGAIGIFHGFIARNPSNNDNVGSRFELTTASTGAFTGKIITGVDSRPFSGALSADVTDVDNPQFTYIFSDDTELAVLLDSASDTLIGYLDDSKKVTAGSLHRATIEGWRNTWNTKNKATGFNVQHNFSLTTQPVTKGNVARVLGSSDDEFPLGFGFGTFNVGESTGAITVNGKLADGRPFFTSTFLGPQGQILVYQPLYANKGSVVGYISLSLKGIKEASKSNLVSGTLTWMKPAPTGVPASGLYPDGFPVVDLTADGGPYVPPGRDQVVMGLPNVDENALLSFSDGGLFPDQIPQSVVSIRRQLVTRHGPHADLVSVLEDTSTIDASPYNVILNIMPLTGAFSGHFTVPGDVKIVSPPDRTVTFEGLIVNGLKGSYGAGYFLLPQQGKSGPAFTRLKLILSGSAYLEPRKLPPP